MVSEEIVLTVSLEEAYLLDTSLTASAIDAQESNDRTDMKAFDALRDKIKNQRRHRSVSPAPAGDADLRERIASEIVSPLLREYLSDIDVPAVRTWRLSNVIADAVLSVVSPAPAGGADLRTRIIERLRESVMYHVCRECNRDCGHESFGDAEEIANTVLAAISPEPR